MAQEIQAFTVTIPAGTQKAANWSAKMDMPPRAVRQIDIRVPPGPRGEMGFQIGSSGVPVIPHNEGGYLVLDNESISWPLENQIDSGGWELFGYNTGTYDHSVYIRFLVDPVTEAAGVQQAQPIQF